MEPSEEMIEAAMEVLALALPHHGPDSFCAGEIRQLAEEVLKAALAGADAKA